MSGYNEFQGRLSRLRENTISRRRIDLVTPKLEEIETVHERYRDKLVELFNELDEDADGFLTIGDIKILGGVMTNHSQDYANASLMMYYAKATAVDNTAGVDSLVNSNIPQVSNSEKRMSIYEFLIFSKLLKTIDEETFMKTIENYITNIRFLRRKITPNQRKALLHLKNNFPDTPPNSEK